MADEAQGLCKVLLQQEAAVLSVGQGPDLAEDGLCDAGALQELDGSVAGDDVGAALVAFAEELAEELSLVRGVVEFWVGWGGSDGGQTGNGTTYKKKLRPRPFSATSSVKRRVGGG
jgi:hypothetical protein